MGDVLDLFWYGAVFCDECSKPSEMCCCGVSCDEGLDDDHSILEAEGL